MDPLPPLDNRDTLLLRDPSGTSSGSRGQINVSFLRRTEYISSEVVRQKVDKTSLKKVVHKVIDPESQLRAVEDTFDAANIPLEEVVHPKNNTLKPVCSFSLLPDFKQLDLNYLSVKMVNSASLSHLKEKQPDICLSTSLFRPTSLETDEWMSFFVSNEHDSSRLKRRLESSNESGVLGEDEETEENEFNIYKFNHLRDYEMELTQHSNKFDDIAINFDNRVEKQKGTAWFVPIAGRTNLKRRRVAESQQKVVDEHNVAAIELSLRELTSEESIGRDNVRAEYDSVSFMPTVEPLSEA